MQTKAFTIMELLVAMAITALLISLTLFGLNLFQKQYLQLQHTQEKIWHLNDFVKVMQQDAFLANRAELSGSVLNLELLEHSISYEFQSDQVLRVLTIAENQFSDTFEVRGNIEKSYFQKQYQERGLIDQCEIAIDAYGEMQHLPIRIWYDAKTYLNEYRY